MNFESYIEQQVLNIKAWELEEPWMVTKALNFITAPLARGINIIIPTSAVEGAISMADWVANLTTSEGWILEQHGFKSIEEVRTLSLEKQDAMADSVHNWAIGIATAEGSVTGALGLPGMAADIPAVMTLAFRTIRQIGLCYGYQLKTDDDFHFALHILSIAGSGSIKEKTASLATLKSLQPTLKATWKAMEVTAQNNPVSREAFLIALKSLLKKLNINLTKAKALQAIPIVGAGVGGTSNLAFMRSVGWSARRTFQRRILEENGVKFD